MQLYNFPSQNLGIVQKTLHATLPYFYDEVIMNTALIGNVEYFE